MIKRRYIVTVVGIGLVLDDTGACVGLRDARHRRVLIAEPARATDGRGRSFKHWTRDSWGGQR